jgi:hypothetical protein
LHRPPHERSLSSVHDLQPSALATDRFLAGALSRPAVRIAEWETALDEIPPIDGVAFRLTVGHHPEVIVERDGFVAQIVLQHGGVHVRAAAASDEEAESFINVMRELFPASVPDPEAPQVPITFWSYSPTGTRSRRRRITVPTWEECAPNYPQRTFADLCDLVEGFTPGAAGQLILWHGDPGTGKTFALRALAWEWREWCSLHYITDPEQLFGEHASYLLDVLLDDDDDGPIRARPVPVGGAAALDVEQEWVDPRAVDGRWRLLVLEDTGELMSADARERSGHGLGRLLNVVDGMIGQGLKVLVLVTTNEMVGRLHPAISRAGRCASQTLFQRMPRVEAEEWLRARGTNPEVVWPSDDYDGPPNSITIADLYALRAGQARDATTGVGFAS